jgi:hypothetical protein
MTDISVVVVVIQGRQSLSICLKSLVDQQINGNKEIIVPYDDRFVDITTLQNYYPNVNFYHLSGTHTYAELRTIGVKQSTGEIIAITEDHCIPAKDWLDQIMRTHKGLYAAVGGVVEKILPDTALNLAVYFADYLRYMPPLPESPTHSLTDLNVSYKREALEAIKEVWVNEFHENVVNGALAESGQVLWLSPNILVHQRRDFTPRAALWDRYAFGRLFASTRLIGSSPLKRLVYIVSSVVLPVLLMVRVLANFLRKRRLVMEFVRAFPFVVLLSLSWAWGEFLGYLTGKAETSIANNQHLTTRNGS